MNRDLTCPPRQRPGVKGVLVGDTPHRAAVVGHPVAVGVDLILVLIVKER